MCKEVSKRRLIPVVLILLLFLAPVFGQDISVGVKGGAGFSTFLGSSFQDYTSSSGYETGFFLPYGGGVFATVGFGDLFALQPEVLFLHLGVTSEATTPSDSDESERTNYIAPSLLAKARFGIFNLFAGDPLPDRQGGLCLQLRAI